MDKKVILINKMGCMLCERVLYEITHERKLSCNAIESKPDMEIIFCSTIEEMMEAFDEAFAR